MNTYASFRPTGFDHAGVIHSEYADRRNWYVAPVGRNRDSGTLDESNFRSALRALGGESDTVEVHRFGHWACGWFELILINPADTAAVAEAEDIENGLADYPIVDEMDHSELEYETAAEAWQRASIRDRVYYCQRFDICIFAARRDDMPESPSGELVGYLADGN